MGFVTRIFHEFWTLLLSVAVNTGLAALSDDTDLKLTAMLIGAVTLALMSGCWASSIAETRLHSPKVHFFIGLLLPLVYPVTILFAMRAGRGPARVSPPPDTGPKPWEEPQQPPKSGRPAAAPEESLEPGAEEEDEFTPQYFRRIARDEDGNYVGPWKITTESQEIIADRILDALPNAVVIETTSIGRQQKPQRLRIPYAKIVSCVRT